MGTASQPETTTQAIVDRVTAALGEQSLEHLAVSVYMANPDTGANLGSWDQASYGAAIAVRVEGDYVPVVRADGPGDPLGAGAPQGRVDDAQRGQLTAGPLLGGAEIRPRCPIESPRVT